MGLVKRLLTSVVLLMLFFNWIGNQLYTTIVEQYANNASNAEARQKANPDKISGLHMCLYAKEIDSDDLLEFTGSTGHSINEIGMNLLNGLFPDRASNENRHISYKFFNGEYVGKAENEFAKYPGSSSQNPQDRFLFKIPVVFLSTHARPPQFPG